MAVQVAGHYQALDSTVGTGPWTMTSTDSTDSLLRYVFDENRTFGELTSLSSSYTDLLGGIQQGTPRFTVVVDQNLDGVADGSFDIQWGPAGSFADPTLGPGDTGNLLALNDVGRYDLTGIGGSVYTDRATALALAGNMRVLRTTLVVDSFGGNDRAIVINNIDVQAVPEPATMAGLGLGAIAVIRRRRKR